VPVTGTLAVPLAVLSASAWEPVLPPACGSLTPTSAKAPSCGHRHGSGPTSLANRLLWKWVRGGAGADNELDMARPVRFVKGVRLGCCGVILGRFFHPAVLVLEFRGELCSDRFQCHETCRGQATSGWGCK